MHSMKLCAGPYEKIKSGKKDIELRLNDEKRQLVKVGDRISFRNIDTGEKLLAECVALHKADSFQELFGKLDANARMGFEEDMSFEEMAREMRQYYPSGKEQQYGVVGIEIKLLP